MVSYVAVCTFKKRVVDINIYYDVSNKESI